MFSLSTGSAAFLTFTLLLPLSAFAEISSKKNYVRIQQPEFLTFEELKTLVDNPTPKGLLGAKLEKFWKTPIISNEAYYQGVRPREVTQAELGRILNVASWNIEKSFHIPRVIKFLTSDDSFKSMIDYEKVNQGSSLYKKLIQQRNRLIQSDILILEEMDIGIQRSGYLNAAAELAKALNMNFAYGAQQLEIDPVLLGLENPANAEEKPGASKTFEVDPVRYKGVFGSAVLSRYPIKNVEVFQLKSQGYNS